MGHDEVAVAKRKLTGAELEKYFGIKKRLEEIWLEDAQLRDELAAMGLKFERKWWHGPLGKPSNFES
jgi:hypothetical protein